MVLSQIVNMKPEVAAITSKYQVPVFSEILQYHSAGHGQIQIDSEGLQ